jgi:hypothetical protein
MKKTIVPFSLLFALATGGVNTQTSDFSDQSFTSHRSLKLKPF